MKKKILFIIVVLINCISINAQKAPMKYGKVDKEDLEMKSYAPDTSASAVVLCNYGYFDANNLQFVHQMRIKILKEEGKSRGNFVVPAAEKAIVKGQTVNLENGTPVITKLNKEGIFIEKVTRDYYRARVVMPNVKVGSVLDVEFFYTGLPSYWSFQETIPVRWSELILEENVNFSFRKNFVGYTSLSEASNDRWVAKNVPAFKSEPYIDNLENYLTRFNIEISSIHIPGVFYKDYATTWDAVAKTLREDDSFGKALTSLNFYMNGVEKDIKASATTPEDKLAKAYEEIRKIKWNKEESIWPSNNGLSYSFNKKIGNSADINLNLVLLLRKLGIEANPVVLSTRENGVLPQYSVSFDKLNYVVVKAEIGDKSYLLDATEDNLPLGLLPTRTINGKGLVINKESQDWIDLSPKLKDKSAIILNLKLSDDGTLTGSMDKSSTDYSALTFRDFYKTFNSQDEYLKKFESDNIGLNVDNYELKGIDSLQQNISERFEIKMKNRVTKANNEMYINPVQFDILSENPFKAEQRQYPVDFVTPKESLQLLSLELPEGYTIEQLPKNIKMTLPENVASFQMQSSVSANKVQVLFKLNLNKSVFYQKEYLDLKTFFDELVKKEAEMLIIKKV